MCAQAPRAAVLPLSDRLGSDGWPSQTTKVYAKSTSYLLRFSTTPTKNHPSSHPPNPRPPHARSEAPSMVRGLLVFPPGAGDESPLHLLVRRGASAQCMPRDRAIDHRVAGPARPMHPQSLLHMQQIIN